MNKSYGPYMRSWHAGQGKSHRVSLRWPKDEDISFHVTLWQPSSRRLLLRFIQAASNPTIFMRFLLCVHTLSATVQFSDLKFH